MKQIQPLGNWEGTLYADISKLSVGILI